MPSDRPRWERWVIALDVPATGTPPPAIIVRHILKRLWRTWGVKCTGFSEDRRLFELTQENKQLRETIVGLMAGESQNNNGQWK